MSDRKYDNDRDRYAYGYDAGQVIDGAVVFDEVLNRFVIVDDDGVAFDPQRALQDLNGKKIRLTMISFESMEEIEKLLAAASGPKN
jgi:hypothetical protein